MVGTVLKNDLGNYVADQFGQWVDNLHASDPPLPPIEIPNPLDAVASAAKQVAQDAGQAASDAFSTFVDQVHQQPAPPPANGTRVSQTSNALEVPTPGPVTAPPEPNPLPAEPSPPPSPFLNWTQQVDTGLGSPSAPVTAPSPPGVATGGGAAPSLPHAEEPGTQTDQVAGGNVGSKWKTQFDFGATYSGNYRTGTPHRGVDLVPSNGRGIGTEVDAFTPGTVSNIFRDSGAGGLVVYVQDQDGLTHAYMHLNDVMPGLQVGQRVDRGTPLAHMGESGTEGSPHLHYEVRKNAAVGDPLDQLIDPRPYVSGGATNVPPTPTTAGLSGGGAQSGQVGDRGNAILGGAADIASWLGSEGQKALQAVLVTEGGLAGARGDNGQSAGPLQFFSGGPDRPGQLDNFARAVGMTVDQAKTYVEQHPLEAITWAIGTPTNPGYLGSAIARGLAQNLSGPDLATYAQREGQVSVSPERAGANYNALFGAGQDALRNVTGGASDVLGASQRLLDQSAQGLVSGASQRVQDASSSLTDWMMERRGQAADIAEGFKAPVTSAVGTVSDVLGQIGELPGLSEADRAARRKMLEESPLGQAYGSELRRELLPNITEPNHPLNVLTDLQQKYADPRTGLVLSDADMTPEDQKRYRDALLAVGGVASPITGPARAAGKVVPPDLDLLATLRRTTAAAAQPVLEGAAAPLSRGQRIADAIDKAVAVTVSNMLSAPASLFTNATAITQNVTRPIESAAVAGIKALGGDIPAARTELGAAGRDLVGQGAALGEVLAGFGRTFARGQERPIDVRREAFPGAAGMFATPALRLNAATDELVRGLGQAGAQAAELTRLKAQHPEMTAAEITERFAPLLQKVGTDAAEQVGFQSGGTGIGTAISRWRGALTRQDATLAERLGGAALHVAVPFSNVPDVILTRGLRRLPVVNELMGIGQSAAAMSRGERDLSQRIGARTLITTAVNLAIYSQVQQGNITGSGPDDPAKRAALMAARDANGNPIWRPNSIRVGDRWLNYGGLGPLSLQLGGIANAHEQYMLEDRKLSPNLAGAIARGVIGTVGDAWYLQSVADLFDAVKTGSFDRAAGRVLGSTADRIIPLGGAVNAIRQWQDEVVRDPQNPLQREMNRIPGLSELVQPKLEPSTGEPVREPRDVVSVLTRATASGEPDPINAELAKHNLGVSDAPNTITRGSATLELTDDEQRRFVELSGPEVAKRVRSVTAASGYANLSSDQQRARLEAAIRVGRDAGEARLWATIPQDERTQRVYAYREAQKRRSEPQVILPR